MADEKQTNPSEAEQKQAALAVLVSKYQSLVDPVERAKFYQANPPLHNVYSQVNHS